ncbi:PucR family transcriptional regulator [Cytobacillus gottheilii]|uniref:PucR family transcriptional regulator n=1 Tax=Cytobacillus gottheilii TaxID=859144 RepID=UPI003CF52EC2
MDDMRAGKDLFKHAFLNLEDLVDKIWDVLECPVTIEDATHRLLAYSTHDDTTDSARIATIISRKVPEKVINSLWKARIIPQLMQSGEPLRIHEMKEIGLGDRVAISIRNHNEVLGYIWVVEGEVKLTEQKLNLLKQAAAAARTELLKLNVQKKKRVESYQDFFWQLLTGSDRNHEEIKNKFEELNIKPPSPFIVLVFQFTENITEKITQNIIYLMTTSQKINISFHAAMGNEFIVLASPPAQENSEAPIIEFLNFFIGEMKSRFQVDGMIGGCGGLYDTYDKVEASYQEAQEVVRLKEQFKDEMDDINSHRQLGIFRYIELLMEKRRQDPFVHPALEELQNYDQEHKTMLLQTLESYINYDSNVNDTAKKLHVHVNTLTYRLKRITEISGIDLKNTNQKVSLFLELKMRRLENKKRRL